MITYDQRGITGAAAQNTKSPAKDIYLHLATYSSFLSAGLHINYLADATMDVGLLKHSCPGTSCTRNILFFR